MVGMIDALDDYVAISYREDENENEPILQRAGLKRSESDGTTLTSSNGCWNADADDATCAVVHHTAWLQSRHNAQLALVHMLPLLSSLDQQGRRSRLNRRVEPPRTVSRRRQCTNGEHRIPRHLSVTALLLLLLLSPLELVYSWTSAFTSKTRICTQGLPRPMVGDRAAEVFEMTLSSLHRRRYLPWSPVATTGAKRTPFKATTMTMSLYGQSRPQDLDISFGSDNGVSWGEDDDDTQERLMNQERVQQLLHQETNDVDKQNRKRQTWGKFASATNRTELERMVQDERIAIQQAFVKKAQLASEMGIELQVLEPRDEDGMLLNGSGDTTTTATATSRPDNPNIQISSPSPNKAQTTASSFWYAELDEDLEDEWRALTGGDDSKGSTSSSKERNGNAVNPIGAESLDDLDGIADGEDDEEDLNDPSSAKTGKKSGSSSLPSWAKPSTASSDVVREERSGQLVARDALSGVRVGSAGGWTLEVFPGDFVVHRKYGIGRFEQTCLRSKTKLTAAEQAAQSQRRAEILTTELRKLQAEGSGGGVTPEQIQMVRSRFGTEEDTDPISNPQATVLEITYDDAVVHVPVDRAYRLSRYRAGDAVVKPKLSKVRGEAWSKAKRKVEASTLELAQDVLALYATRETLSRTPFDPSVEPRVKDFETSFTFSPTPDQKKCFEDVENDMVWRSRPMDRLVCGDVGFGKTEVAVRALFRCVVNKKQAALLAPTGVLAAQHYKNIVKRMGPGTPYNLTIGLLRGGMGKNTKSGREMRETIRNGEIQLIVGTHALLSNDLEYNDLGLLVVDEEQRFGVKQKERLKLICNGVDVLTLSATPIPRTLQMSLSGIRDTSTIRSPPPMRKPTITYVQDFSESMVQKAIQDELGRGGQCYYVVPRISMLEEAETLIRKLFPGIRIIQAHGRMQRNGAEENVAEFAEGRYDVLLATTVIENGVDIPTVNTIIVQNSQSFGMSTLYQLRGRVGRSDKQAYAYFLHREESITEHAVMRLQAIGELHELGSGFDVANRDLEIRGAGSLLGTEQSGMAAKVGFDLYMRMLKKSIRRLRGLDLPIVPRTKVLFPIDGSPDTFRLPKSFVADDKERLSEEGKARLAESTSSLVALTTTWKDTYGPLPATLQNQLKALHLHACTRKLGIDLVGLVSRKVKNAAVDGGSDDIVDCVLRSPGLRPRHWATIIAELPTKAPPKGLNVVFPARFTLSGDEQEIVGGVKIDLATLHDDSLNEDKEEEVWDAMDQEEVEAMNIISSAVNVRNMTEVDIEQYPRFILPNFATTDKAVDRLLKLLLPIAKIVHEKQSEQASNAKAAATLREKQDAIKQHRQMAETVEARRAGYRY